LPVLLERYANLFKPEAPVGALVVETDAQIEKVRALLQEKVAQGVTWASKLARVVSLETPARMQSEPRYARIETWPDDADTISTSSEMTDSRSDELEFTPG
jgi:hypothetical protein